MQECSGNRHVFESGGAKASLPLLPPVPADARLQLIINAWPAMAEAIKERIVAMVKM
jgi:hypothetical protein